MSRIELFRTAVVLCGWLAGASLPAQQAYQDLSNIPVPDPDEERKTFILPEGFEVNLYAADPAIAKPIQMNFDPQGRLWIASSEVYPQIEPGQKATDKILVLEDLDGDGVSDKTHVFADGLLIPTGIAPGDGGAYVGASTELLHYRDTDGDLKADKVEVVLSGFGTEDTHHIIHTFRWGPEQRLYFSQSIYIHSHVETPWGVRRLNAGGIWRFRPETLQLDVLARGWINTWGNDFDRYGATFATDGAGGEGINYVVPGAAYATAFGAARILPGLNPGSPKHCGLEIVASEHLPDDWQESLLTNDFRGHRVCRFTVTRDGSGYLSQEHQEVIRSNHPAFRPVDVKLGPDGAIYIADWYNPVIQHGEVDFRDPRRDRTHGRIWRVTYKGKPLVPRVDLAKVSSDDLVKELASPNVWTRQSAKRLLKERGADVLPSLRKWVGQLDASSAADAQRLEALWMFLAFDAVDADLLASLLRSNDPGVRAGATRVVGDWHARLSDPLALLSPLVSDADGRVRLEAVRALAEIPTPRAMEVAVRALDAADGSAYPVDRWLDYALWQTSRDLQNVWEPALLNGEIDFGGNARHIAFVLKSAGSAQTVPVLVQLVEKNAVNQRDLGDVLEVIASFGRPEDLQRLVTLAINGDDASAQPLLNALAVAHRTRKVIPAGSLGELTTRADRGAPNVRAAVARLIGAWKLEESWPWLAALTEGDSTAVRLAAIDGLSAFGGARSAERLKTLATVDDAATRQAAIIGLLPNDPREAARLAVQHLASTQAADSTTALFQAFVSRPDGPDLLAAALENNTAPQIPSDAAVIGLRAVRASGRQYPKLEAALAKAGGVSSGAKPLTPEELKQLVTAVGTQGNPQRGEAIFRRKDLSCLQCHAVGDAGGIVGPNILSLGATAQIDYLLESLLDPNAKLKEGYHTTVLVDSDGRQWVGIKLRQTDTAVVIRNADGDEFSIPVNSIEAEAAGVSLMPAGLTEKLTRQELVDLTAFLAALGKQPDFTIGQEQIARRWQLLEPTPSAAQAIRRMGFARTTDVTDNSFHWRTIYSQVNGSLPLPELPAVAPAVPGSPLIEAFVRCEVEVAQPGDVQLGVNSPEGLQVWLGEKPIDPGTLQAIPLSKGRHRITIGIDKSVRTAPLKLQLTIPDGSAAAAKFVGGT